MSKAIPYIKELEVGKGAFITLSNNIILVEGNHDKTAYNLIHGNNKFLNEKERELFSYWKEYNKHWHNDREADFLVYVLSYDKVENLRKHFITTSNPKPYTRFFNYSLMDWEILQQKKMIFNQQTKSFENSHLSEWFYGSIEEIDSKQELEDIKNHILLKDRHYFFKD